MSVKHCGEHGHYCRRRKLYRRVFATILTLIILVLCVILIIWLVLRPTKPKFYLQDATVYQFNVSNAYDPNINNHLLTSTTQITLSSRNPNDRIGIYYDRLHVYIAYQNQQVTVPTALPTGYQGHNDVTIWSPYIYGADVPVAPYVAAALGQDENAGYLLLYVKVEGKLRWKVGSWISGGYHISVNCPAFISVDRGNGGGASGRGFHFQHISTCSVDV